MKIINADQFKDTELDVQFTGGHSYRMATAKDGLGFSVNKTFIPKSDTPHLWHYKYHKEACYCISGYGEVVDLETGERHEIKQDSLYLLPSHERMTFQAHTDVVLISIFNPPLTGNETHDADGSYEGNAISSLTQQLCEQVDKIQGESDKIATLNDIRMQLHQTSPMKHHPVDCILWEKSADIEVQKINPNSIPPPEFELLYQSILNDGYTMPVVSWRQPDGSVRVVDGFHRRKIERMHKDISDSTYGHIPVSFVRSSQSDESDRMASTIRHNRARGVHNIELMSTIVAELVEMGKGDRWICQHIGMSPDELLRLKQITGLASLFANKDFSMSWEPESNGDGTFEFKTIEDEE